MTGKRNKTEMWDTRGKTFDDSGNENKLQAVPCNNSLFIAYIN